MPGNAGDDDGDADENAGRTGGFDVGTEDEDQDRNNELAAGNTKQATDRTYGDASDQPDSRPEDLIGRQTERS